MPRFKATAPDGSSWGVDVPDGMPQEQVAKEVDAAFAQHKSPDPLKEVAEETPEWERRAAAVGRSMSAPVEGVEQAREHAVGWLAEKIAGWIGKPDLEAKVKADVAKRLRVADEEAGGQERAMQALYRASPAARATGIASDVSTGFLLPGVRAAEGAGAVARIGAGGATGAVYAASNPTSGEGDFVTEKAKQAGLGFLAGGTLTGIAEGLGRGAGAVKSAVSRFLDSGKPIEPGPAGEGAEKVTKALQGIRERIEAKVGAKGRRAEDALAGAESAAAGEPVATAGELGAVARGAMQARKAELEAVRDTEAMPLLDAALNSGAKINVSGIPKQIDLMLKNEKNPDIVKALLKAKAMMYSREGGEAAQAFDKFDLKTAEGRTALQKALEAADGKRQLDTSVRGLDSARLAIKSMIGGEGSEPADRFAKAQLVKILGMLEEGLSKGAPEYGEYLSKYRQLSKPLDQYSATSGSGRRAAATLQKDQFEGDFMSSPEAMGNRFFKSGDEGAAAAREFKQAVGGDENSTRAMSNYIAGKLKGMSPDKWGSFLNKHEPALREYGLFDRLKTMEETAARSRAGVEKAQATAKNVERIMKETALGKLTRDSQSFRAIAGEDAQAAIEKVFAGRTPVRDLQQLVALTKNTPEAADGLRQAFKEWLTKPDSTGGVDTKQLLTRWRSIRGAVEKSGLIDADHAANIDAIMGDLQKSYAAEGVKKFGASVAGWLAGLTVGRPISGSYIGRNVAGARIAQKQREIEDAILQMMSDPAKARVLAAPPTPQNTAQAKAWIDSDFSIYLETGSSVVGGREAGERKPKPATPHERQQRAVDSVMQGVRG